MHDQINVPAQLIGIGAIGHLVQHLGGLGADHVQRGAHVVGNVAHENRLVLLRLVEFCDGVTQLRRALGDGRLESARLGLLRVNQCVVDAGDRQRLDGTSLGGPGGPITAGEAAHDADQIL